MPAMWSLPGEAGLFSVAGRIYDPRMIRWIRLPLSLCLLAALGSGCALFRRPPRAEKKADAEKVAAARRPLQTVGKIAVVNMKDAFVLIDSGAHPAPPAGAKLRGYTGPVESAELKASDVQRRPFVVADILSGTPQQGDEVFLRGEPLTARAVPPEAR